MSSARRILSLMLMLTLGTALMAQTPRSEDDPRNLAPTVTGGTGLFTVYDAQTLRRGEFNFGFFANYFHRDAGDARFQVYPANFQVGFNDYVEFFVNFEAQKVISTGQPSLLSGYYLPDVRTRTLSPGRVTIRPGTNVVGVTVGDPCANGGFAGPCASFGAFTARPSGNNTAVYPGLGAAVGGILPGITPPFGNGIVPNYLPSAPFLSRFTGTGVGDITLGAKIRFTPANNAFGAAFIPIFKIPTTRTLNTGLERGRGTGAFDYGLILALDGRLHKHINLSANAGFIKRGDPRAEDMRLGPLGGGALIGGFGRSTSALDLPNEFRSGIGVDFPLSQYLAFMAEITGTRYVGSRTPMLITNNPVDLVAGARIFPSRWFSLTAAYQRHLNWLSNFDSATGSPNGFIAGLSLGHVNKREPAILPNNAPTIALSVGSVTNNTRDLVHADASTVCVGDTVAISASASDPDGDTLTYKWTTTGGSISGDGPNLTFNSAGLAPGEYTITCEVDDGCGCVAFDTKTVRVSTCPPVLVCFTTTSLDVTPASTSDINPGEAVTLSTSGVSGGKAFGDVTYTWTASAGTITGNGTSARLDTTGVPNGTTVNVTVTANSSMGNCSASGSATVTTKATPPPPARPKATELSSCTSFKNNNARVDNACKAILQDAIRQLQSDPQSQLVIYSYKGEKEKPATLDMQRGKNVRDRLADGSLGSAIDANRIVVRPSGVHTDGRQVRLWFVPANADTSDMPQGTDATLGDVTPEKKAAPARRPAKKRR